MEHGCTNLTEAVRSVQLLKIDGYCGTSVWSSSDCIKSRWNVDGHDWEVHFYPRYSASGYCILLKLLLVSEPQRDKLTANLTARLVDPSRNLDPSEEKSMSHVFGSGCGVSSSELLLFLMARHNPQLLGYLVNDSLTVQCTITVLKPLPNVVVPATNREAIPPLPSSDLSRHFGELLLGQRGTDVTFVLDSGDRFPAHKTILAARSPVFMAEFLGDMNERSSQTVQIEDMRAAVFKALLHFIYTDTAPELDDEPEAAAVMAEHLLAAADRYGLDRLKLMCELKLSDGIDVDTAATTLALAEQHSCSVLKAKCVDFITRSPETLDAFLATDGYKHLVESCPLVFTELLRVAHGRRN